VELIIDESKFQVVDAVTQKRVKTLIEEFYSRVNKMYRLTASREQY